MPDTMDQEVVDAMAELLGIAPDASSPPAADTTVADLGKLLGLKPDP